jgi:hypothetical protein
MWTENTANNAERNYQSIGFRENRPFFQRKIGKNRQK